MRSEAELQEDAALFTPSQEERELCALVDEAIGSYLTWDKREVGTVSYTGQRFAVRNLSISQVVTLLIERKRRKDAGESLAGIDRFLLDHGYQWRPFEPAMQEAQAPHKRAERRKR
jgi:hypothetical protein